MLQKNQGNGGDRYKQNIRHIDFSTRAGQRGDRVKINEVCYVHV